MAHYEVRAFLVPGFNVSAVRLVHTAPAGDVIVVRGAYRVAVLVDHHAEGVRLLSRSAVRAEIQRTLAVFHERCPVYFAFASITNHLSISSLTGESVVSRPPTPNLH